MRVVVCMCGLQFACVVCVVCAFRCFAFNCVFVARGVAQVCCLCGCVVAVLCVHVMCVWLGFCLCLIRVLV